MKFKEVIMKDTLKKRIEKVKEEIQGLNIIRPGKLSKQKRGINSRYNYLSYTFRNKGETDYIKEKYIPKIIKETDDFKKFRELSEEWIELSIELSKLEMES
jgi:hypothetical protein